MDGKRRNLGLLTVGIMLIVIIADQILKIWVKTHFYLGEEIRITDWFRLLFIQNKGMAFGMELGSKYFLTSFRVIAVVFLCYYVVRCLRYLPKVKTGYLVCLALVTAGAAGNIFDCLFYGLIFNNPLPPQVAQIFPPDGGYAPFMQGQVVDMLYFPLVSFDWPAWVPQVGGKHFLFFQPVFNLADAAISVGMLVILFFYARQLVWPEKPTADADSTES